MYDADNHAAFRSNCQLPDQFCTMTLLLGAAIVVLAGALDLGKHVALVPNVVVSGFMNGIAVLIWQKQLARLLGAMPGSSGLNLVIALATVVLLVGGSGIGEPLRRRPEETEGKAQQERPTDAP